jgi:cytoskeleton-associated protein 5
MKICEKLAQAMGTQGKRYVATFAPNMIVALGDSKENVRKSSITSMNAFVDNCGGLMPFIENELLSSSMTAATNPNIKAELCGWLIENLQKIKPGKHLPPQELKPIVPTVFSYVEDRHPDVRAKSQELIMPLMTHVGTNEMLRAMQKLKPPSVSIIQPLIEKAKAEIQAKQPPPPPKPAPSGPTITKPAQPAAKKNTLYDTDDSNDDAPAAPLAATKKETTKPGSASTKAKEEEKPNNNKKPVPAPAASSKKKGEEEDLSPIMQVSNKQQRIDQEKALKTLKWNFDNPRKEFIEQLRTQMENAMFNKTILGFLFHDDFTKHQKAIEMLSKCVDDMPDATTTNLDLILRWLTLRFFETNPTVIMKTIDYMVSLFNLLIRTKYTLLDFEANAFIPYFIGKLGDPKDVIRKGFKQITKLIEQVYAPTKVFNLLIAGLASKNARQRAECLDELGYMIETMGLNSFNPSVNLKEIAKQIGDRDNSVRNAALNTVTIAFQIVGEQVYKYVGKVLKFFVFKTKFDILRAATGYL